MVDTPPSASEPRLTFEVDVIAAAGAQRIEAYLAQPTLDPELPNCWSCKVGWSGAEAIHQRAYGATSLQALSLGADMLAMLLTSAFPEAAFQQDGLPFVIFGVSVSGHPSP